MIELPTGGPEWVLDVASVEDFLRDVGFGVDIAGPINAAASAVRAASSTRAGENEEFLRLCRAWPSDPDALAALDSGRRALAVVALMPAAIAAHRERGVPEAISLATMRDMQRHTEISESGWSFCKQRWLRNHVGGQFFEIGRLQFHPGPFGWLVRVYRDSETGAVRTLALGGRRCTAGGWPVGEEEQADVAFTTVFEEGPDGTTGHEVSPEDGSIAAEPSRVPPGSTVLLDGEAVVIHIHIPSGDRLDPVACSASVKEAKRFFAQHFPEVPLRAFCTGTWLLDRELGKVLPPHSNIVRFGRLFRPLPMAGANDNQLRERAFPRDANGQSVPWENCVAVTSLQRAVLEHHRNGGHFRMTAGFILRDEVDELDSGDAEY